MMEEPDPFLVWCSDHEVSPEESFAEYMKETTGFDGQQFSLSEVERWWIFRANEVIEWLRLFAVSEAPEPLDAALKCLESLRPIPASLVFP